MTQRPFGTYDHHRVALATLLLIIEHPYPAYPGAPGCVVCGALLTTMSIDAARNVAAYTSHEEALKAC